MQKLRYLIYELQQIQPASISELAEALGQSQTTTRQHLKRLIKMELVVHVAFEKHSLYLLNGSHAAVAQSVLDGLYE